MLHFAIIFVHAVQFFHRSAVGHISSVQEEVYVTIWKWEIVLDLSMHVMRVAHVHETQALGRRLMNLELIPGRSRCILIIWLDQLESCTHLQKGHRTMTL